ncbi:MAG: ABC transporter substrate-binding protein [Streptosporangiaceae bacterium]|jgi:sulfonate transport system substrate-binding protein
MTTPVRPRYGRVLIAVAGTAAVLAAAACSSSSSSPAASSPSGSSSSGATNVSSVTLNIGDQKGTGAQALLEAAGLINKLPFKASWSDFTSGPPMLQAMGSGSVDIGGVGDAPPVFAASGNEPIAIAGARVTPAAAAAIVVPKNSPITSISQLKGKKIAVAQGSSADYHLLTVLNKAGLTTKQVTLDYLQPADALAAFNSGHVDAWDIWSPYIEQTTLLENARILVNGDGYGSPDSFEVASKAALDNPAKAAAIKDYLTILNQAYVWSATHIATWAKLWGDATGLPSNVMTQAAKDDINKPITITSGVISAEQQLVTAFYKAGLIPNSVNIKQYTVTTYNGTVPGGSS